MSAKPLWQMEKNPCGIQEFFDKNTLQPKFQFLPFFFIKLILLELKSKISSDPGLW